MYSSFFFRCSFYGMHLGSSSPFTLLYSRSFAVLLTLAAKQPVVRVEHSTVLYIGTSTVVDKSSKPPVGESGGCLGVVCYFVLLSSFLGSIYTEAAGAAGRRQRLTGQRRTVLLLQNRFRLQRYVVADAPPPLSFCYCTRFSILFPSRVNLYCFNPIFFFFFSSTLLKKSYFL